MSALEAIRAATLNGARYIGMDKDLGSIEAGKLADMIILDANPLEDLFNTDKIHSVVMNGRIYQASDLKEMHTGNQPPASYYFQRSKSQAFPWGHFHNAGGSTCRCHATH
jgi:adenine deaminase